MVLPYFTQQHWKVSASLLNCVSPPSHFSLSIFDLPICLFNISAIKIKNIWLIHLIAVPFKWQFSLHPRHSTVTRGVIPLWRRLYWQTTHPSHPAQKGAENRVLLCSPHSQPGNRRHKSYRVSTECLQPRGLQAKGAAFIFQLVGNFMLAKYLLGMIDHCLEMHCWNSQILWMVGFMFYLQNLQILEGFPRGSVETFSWLFPFASRWWSVLASYRSIQSEYSGLNKLPKYSRLASLAAVGITYSIWFSAFNMATPLGCFAVAP